MNLGRKIKAYRKRYRITQGEFAELVGSTRTTVCLWEREINRPRIKAVVERIEGVLKKGKPSVKKVKVT